ncbi:MAG: hypothetical protein MUO88_12365, partial [Desulfobacterales bacterium]|nr:hypothetical protein [Desulfobacterales bacterium]
FIIRTYKKLYKKFQFLYKAGHGQFLTQGYGSIVQTKNQQHYENNQNLKISKIIPHIHTVGT